MVFPIGRTDRYMKRMRLSERSGKSAPTFVAAVLEYMCTELLDMASEVALKAKRQRLMPIDI